MKTKSDDSIASFLLDLDCSTMNDGTNADECQEPPLAEAVAVPVVAPSAPYEGDVLQSQREQLGVQHRASAYRPPPTAPLQEQHYPLGDDREAHAAAAAARDEGVTMIRDHLSSYLEQNPGASYVTWIATLHPENAEVTIDPRFHIPGNPWATVYEDAKAAMGAGLVDQDQSESDKNHPGIADATNNTTRHACAVGGLIPLMIGFSMIASAMGLALSLQLTSTIVYLLAVANQAIVRALPSYNICAQLIRIPCWWLVQLFRFTDSLVLVIDTLMVEMLAAMAWFLCGCFSLRADVALFYHQWTRRSAHMVRWAFRKPLEGCRPRRTFWCTSSGSTTGPPDRAWSQDSDEERHHEYRLASADEDDDSARIP